MSERTIAHLVDLNKHSLAIGSEVEGYCGTVFVIEERAPDRPLCMGCHNVYEIENDRYWDKANAVLRDYASRMHDLAVAFDTRSHMDTRTEELMWDVFMRHGASNPHFGPLMENDEFISKKE